MDFSSCGLVCEACPAFMAYMNDDDALRAETAVLWSAQYQTAIRPEDVNCTGCRQDGVKIGHCHVCPIRACCVDNALPHCGACDRFACETLEGFFTMFPDGGAANRARLTEKAEG